MAHTKSSGAAKYGRDSQPKYLGIKKHDGEQVKVGDILVRQRGTKFLAGQGVKLAKDYTLFAVKNGTVQFKTHRKIKFDGNKRYTKMVAVLAS